jgi:hypothetical protein
MRIWVDNSQKAARCIGHEHRDHGGR